MKYRGHQNYRHDSPRTSGVLLVNLGTPDAPDRRNVRRYLQQFLSDPRVVEAPRWLWWLVLRLIILNVRPARSAEAYRHIWTDEGSPLLAVSHRQQQGLRRLLQTHFGDGIKVELGMRYGSPSIAEGLARLHQSTVRDIIVLPLYPQYSGSTGGSVFDAVAECLMRWRWVPTLKFIGGYHDDPDYIEALAAKIEGFWRRRERGEHLLISFHGIPRRYVLNGDPYYCHCHKTARLLARRLRLADERWSLVFQSRFGREEWLKPYCDEHLEHLLRDGVRRVDIVCPGFAADCLETLEEIDVQYRRQFLDAGGECFNYIPCLNDDHAHLELLSRLVCDNLPGDVSRLGDKDPADTLELARSRGAES